MLSEKDYVAMKKERLGPWVGAKSMK